MTIHTVHGFTPTLGERVFVAPGARVLGDVTVGDDGYTDRYLSEDLDREGGA